MSNVPAILARLAGLYKETQKVNGVSTLIEKRVEELYARYELIAKDLRAALPDLYSDLPTRRYPAIALAHEKPELFYMLVSDMEYILEVRANSEIGQSEINESIIESKPNRVFISHGRSPDWREVQDYIEKDINIPTLELAQEPNRGRTILQKLHEESEKCSFAVIVMTADDEVVSGTPRARENVIHEIGFFQAKFGFPNVCLLHEEGTNIPSNIHGLVYIPFPKGLISATFGVLGRELRTALII